MTSRPTLRIIGAETVRALLPLEDCIGLMRDAFRAEAEGRAVQPLRQVLPLADGRGALGMMPGVLTAPDWLGVKVVSVFPGNAGGELGVHQGPVLLFDRENGRLVAAVEARAITGIRTAAASAAATDALAREDARSLGLFGCGEQAREHAAAMAAVRPIDSILVWGRDQRKAEAFAASLGPNARAVAGPEEAASADVLCLVTAASEPYFRGAWLRAGQHMILVGSSVPSTAEVDSETLARSRVFVDFEESARALGGELRRAIASGAVGADHIAGSVGQVLAGALEGRRSPDEITLFKSLGMVAEDLIAADFVLRRAEECGLGAVVDF